MRYVSLAYGTRAEIEDEIRRGLGANRSDRRRRELELALADLQAGDHSVTFGNTTFIVDETGGEGVGENV